MGYQKRDDLFIYEVPLLSTGHLEDEDMEKFTDRDRTYGELACMWDPADPGGGFFVWVDEVGEDDEAPPPPGYSEKFNKFWYWAQENNYQWVRFGSWGDDNKDLEYYKIKPRTTKRNEEQCYRRASRGAKEVP